MAWYDGVAVTCVVIDQRSCECEIQMSFLQFYYLWSTIPVGLYQRNFMIPFADGLKMNSLSFCNAFHKKDRLPYMVFQRRRGISMLLLTFSLYGSNSSQQISTMFLKKSKKQI